MSHEGHQHHSPGASTSSANEAEHSKHGAHSASTSPTTEGPAHHAAHGAHAGPATDAGHEHHDDHSHHDPDVFKRKFWLSLVLTIPTLIFSHGLQGILGIDGPRFPGSQFIPAVFGIALFLYGGMVFLKGGLQELKARQPGMMTLISLAILVAFGYSLAVTLGLPGMDFWWELATLITIMLLGHWIEMKAVRGAQDALGELAKLLPDTADVVHGDTTMTHPVADLKVGDLVLVRPGAAVPADGEVTDGDSQVNEALLTGESSTVHKKPRDQVIAGSINEAGALTVRVTKVGSETALAGIMKLVAEAQASKSNSQLLADRAAALLFYVAVAVAIITAIAWTLLQPDDPRFVLERVVTVLVIACPHALGLAIPLVAQISTSIGARRGILIRNRLALEAARTVDVVLFDKTGTLTEGRQGVVDVVAAPGRDKDELLALAAAVEASAEHPIGRTIVTEAAERELVSAGRASSFAGLAGRGAEAMVADRMVTVGSARLVNERGLSIGSELVHATRAHTGGGRSVVYVIDGDTVAGMIAVADVIRPESADAVSMLKARGIRVAMLTGDSHEVGSWVAGQLGITEVFAEVLPGQKSDVVARLQDGGTGVAMVGDGVNDAPALAQADVGIAIGAGTDVAIESAGIVLASSDPRGVVDAIRLSQGTYRKELQNLWWAAGYNILGLPLAAGVLAGVGILMPPALGAALMAISTLVVALNAQLLRTLRFSQD